MYLKLNSGRMVQKIITNSGTPFAVAPSNDHTDRTWLNYHLYNGEIGINVPLLQFAVRISGSIYYLPLISTPGTSGQVLTSQGAGLPAYWAASSGATAPVTSVNSQTGAVVLTTANVADSSNKRYVSDADLTDIGNLSGVNTGDQNLAPYFNKSVDDSDDITEGATKLLLTTTERTKLSNTSGINTGDNATNTQYSGLAASKLNVISEAEIDVGSTPVVDASIAVTNASVTATSKMIGGVAYKAPTGKDLDELEMDALEVKFEPGSGTFNVHIKGLEGDIADKFIIWYTFS